MEDRVRVLEQEFEKSLQRAIELKVQMDLEKGVVSKTKVPHYSVIENSAHEVGRELSRRVQQQHMNALAARKMGAAKCPKCGDRCDLAADQRQVTALDGTFPLLELQGYCSACRRAFFPST